MNLEKRISVLEKLVQGQKRNISLIVISNITTIIIVMTLSNRLSRVIEILNKTVIQFVDLTP